jgi:hypothetical protein
MEYHVKRAFDSDERGVTKVGESFEPSSPRRAQALCNAGLIAALTPTSQPARSRKPSVASKPPLSLKGGKAFVHAPGNRDAARQRFTK